MATTPYIHLRFDSRIKPKFFDCRYVMGGEGGVWSLFLCSVSVFSISLRKREMIALLYLRICCRVCVCVCMHSVSLPRDAMGWSVIFE